MDISHVLLWPGKGAGWTSVVEDWTRAGFLVETLCPEMEPSEVARLAAREPSVVIVDLAADLLRGLEVVSACRRMAPLAPVVVVAGDVSVELARSLRSSGVFYVAVHPVELQEMREVLLNALASIRGEQPVPSAVRMRDRVLVVDDDPDFVSAVTALLESEGYAVSTATSGREALKVLAEERPALVVLDIMMENEWAGYAVNQALIWGEGYERARSIPVLMVSSVSMDPATRFHGAGKVGMVTPDAYMTKPLDTVKFLARVRDLIASHRPRGT